jgi:hypothetical protein
MSKEKSADLVEIRDILKKELNKFSNVQATLQRTSDAFNKVDQNYSKYENEIDQSKKHINELKKKEFYENLFIYIAFGFFLCCVAFVLLKRFPLHRIIYLIYSTLEYLFGLLISSYKKLMDIINIPEDNRLVNNTIGGIINNTTIQKTIHNNSLLNNTIIKDVAKAVKKAASKNITK